MKKITYTIIYACFCSLSVMFSGFFWSRNKFDYNSRFFSQRWWEKNMKIYKLLKVAKWKDKLPDVSVIFNKLPVKKLGTLTVDTVKTLIKETCVAEFAHVLLIILAIPTIHFLDGADGYIFFFIYGIIGNLPFIIIQRYNRPRLIKLLEKMEKNNESINSNM